MTFLQVHPDTLQQFPHGFFWSQMSGDRLKSLHIILTGQTRTGLKILIFFCLRRGWRDFEWKYKGMNFVPEDGFTISGRVRKKFADVPVKNSKISIALFKSGNPFSATVPTDSSGRFRLEGIDLTGEAKLIASVTGDRDDLKGWLLLDSLKYLPATISKDERLSGLNLAAAQAESGDSLSGGNQVITRSFHKYIQYAEYKSSIEKKYKLSDTIALGEVTVSAKRIDWDRDCPVKKQALSQGHA
ncbi:MAG: carboxypeptidase-like regulatory domain-containing protein [Sphingobacterium sp.]|nr:carboxypeptidase-like regulatory domain-containing protein [Sphingobacterium sp.]